MTLYRVKFWGKSGKGYYLDCDTQEQAQEFYDRLDGRAEIQEWNSQLQGYKGILYPSSGELKGR